MSFHARKYCAAFCTAGGSRLARAPGRDIRLRGRVGTSISYYFPGRSLFSFQCWKLLVIASRRITRSFPCTTTCFPERPATVLRLRTMRHVKIRHYSLSARRGLAFPARRRPVSCTGWRWPGVYGQRALVSPTRRGARSFERCVMTALN